MPVPVVESVAYSVDDADPSEEVDVADEASTLVQPSGLTTGEFIFPFVGIESDGSIAPAFDDVDNKPTGCTLIEEFGDAGNIDVWGAAFYRQITGGETWPLAVAFDANGGTVDFGGITLRVSGVHTSSPINAVGTTTDFLSVTDKIVTSVDTTEADCLGVAQFIFDGADGSPISLHADSLAAGWTLAAQRVINTGAVGLVLAVATKSQPTAGALGDCHFVPSASDGGSGVMFAIRGAAGGGGVTLTVPDMAAAVALDEAALTQANTLAVDDAAIAATLDNVGLTQANMLAAGDLLVAGVFDGVGLTQANTLSVDDLAAATAMDNVVLAQAYVLIVPDMAGAVALDGVALSTAVLLSVSDLLAASTFENVALTQANILGADSLGIAIALEAPTLSTSSTLSVEDMAVAAGVGSPVLTHNQLLAVQDMLVGLAMDSPALLTGSVLVVPDMSVLAGMELVNLGGGVFLADNIILVSGFDRIVKVESYDRIVKVDG